MVHHTSNNRCGGMYRPPSNSLSRDIVDSIMCKVKLFRASVMMLHGSDRNSNDRPTVSSNSYSMLAASNSAAIGQDMA